MVKRFHVPHRLRSGDRKISVSSLLTEPVSLSSRPEAIISDMTAIRYGSYQTNPGIQMSPERGSHHMWISLGFIPVWPKIILR